MTYRTGLTGYILAAAILATSLIFSLKSNYFLHSSSLTPLSSVSATAVVRELPSLDFPKTAAFASPEYILTHASMYDPLRVANAIPNADPRLTAWMTQYLEELQLHSGTSALRLSELKQILNESKLSFTQLNALCKSMRWVSAAKPLHVVTVAQAGRELAYIPTGSAAAAPFITELWGLGDGLKTLEEWEVAERMYALMMPYETPKLEHARSAAYLHAEQFYRLGRYVDADRAFSGVLSRVSDTMPIAEKADVHWSKGLMLFALAKYDEAIPHFKMASEVSGPAQKPSNQLLFECLLKTGKMNDAEIYCRLFIKRFRPPDQIASYMLSRLKPKVILNDIK